MYFSFWNRTWGFERYAALWRKGYPQMPTQYLHGIYTNATGATITLRRAQGHAWSPTRLRIYRPYLGWRMWIGKSRRNPADIWSVLGSSLGTVPWYASTSFGTNDSIAEPLNPCGGRWYAVKADFIRITYFERLNLMTPVQTENCGTR